MGASAAQCGRVLDARCAGRNRTDRDSESPKEFRDKVGDSACVHSRFVNRFVDLFEFATRSIFNYPRPGFIRFAKSNSIGMPWAAVSPQRLVGQFTFEQ